MLVVVTSGAMLDYRLDPYNEQADVKDYWDAKSQVGHAAEERDHIEDDQEKVRFWVQIQNCLRYVIIVSICLIH